METRSHAVTSTKSLSTILGSDDYYSPNVKGPVKGLAPAKSSHGKFITVSDKFLCISVNS